MNLESLSASIYYTATMNQVLCNSLGTMRGKADLDPSLVVLSSWTSPDAAHALAAPFPHRRIQFGPSIKYLSISVRKEMLQEPMLLSASTF